MTPIDPATLPAASALEHIARGGLLDYARVADRSERPLPVAVLDTNVVLDLWYWDDRDARALRQAVEDKRLACACTFGCLVELADVIGRGRFALSVGEQEALLMKYAGLCLMVSDAYPPSAVRCRDRDDQKFLDLADAVKADLLFTKDKLLLRAGRRLRGAGTATLPPKDWAAL